VTAAAWLQLGQWVLVTLAVLLLASLRAGIKGGQWLSSGESLKERFDRASEKMSNLATEVQGLPERLRQENDMRYMSATLSEERWLELRWHVQRLEDRLRLVELDQARRDGGGR